MIVSKQGSRVIAIGDIHGCATALVALLEAIDPLPDDIVVTLGDYIDRGPNSREVLETLLALRSHCRLTPLFGNHEEMLFAAFGDADHLDFWLRFGGEETLDSYGPDRSLDLIPVEHLRFLRACRSYFETETHFFAHANYRCDLPLSETDTDTLRWRPLGAVPQHPHFSGRVGVVGHVPQASGRIADLDCVLGIDTGCCLGGWLTALDVGSGQVWQSNQSGDVR